MRTFRSGLIGVFSVLVLLAVGCGDDGSGDQVATSSESSQVEAPVSTAPTESSPVEAPVSTAAAGWSGVPAPECDYYNGLAVGSDTTIWAGGVGLNAFDGSEWRQLTEEDGLPVSDRAADGTETASGGSEPCESAGPAVNDVVVAPDGTVWLTTLDAGGGFVVSYDGTSFEQYSYPGGVAPTTFADYLRVDGDRAVWFPTFELKTSMVEGDEGSYEEVTEPFTGVARLRDDGGWDEFPLDAALWPPPRFEVAPDGVAWLVTSDSIQELSDGSWVELDVADLVTLGEIGFAAAGPEGLWVGVQQGGTQVALAHRVDDAWAVETEGLPGLFGEYVVDPTGLVWGPLWPPDEGEDFAGLAAFDGAEWTVYPAEDLTPFGAPGPPYLLVADGSSVLIGTPAGFGDLFRFGTG